MNPGSILAIDWLFTIGGPPFWTEVIDLAIVCIELIYARKVLWTFIQKDKSYLVEFLSELKETFIKPFIS